MVERPECKYYPFVESGGSALQHTHALDDRQIPFNKKLRQSTIKFQKLHILVSWSRAHLQRGRYATLTGPRGDRVAI